MAEVVSRENHRANRPEPQPRMTASKRPTPRRILLYLACVALLMFSDPRAATFWAGAAFLVPAVLLRIWAFGHLEKNQLLVTTGPYAHTRNPAYLGSLLAAVGIGLAAGNPDTLRGRCVWGLAAFLILVFFLFYLPRKFRREYPRLQALFGEQVDRHAEHVPDFLPQLKPWRSGDDRRFSLALVGENHEWPWSLVLTAAMAAIWWVEAWSPLGSWGTG